MGRKLSAGVHNVRVGGRMRRVKVLASGKWRFLKSKVTRKTKKGTGRKTTRRTMAKKKRRRSFFSVSTLFKWFRVAALVAPAVGRAMEQGRTPYYKVRMGVLAYTGFDIKMHTFNFGRMAEGWMPYLATTVITKGVQKLSGILRSL